MVNDDNIKYFPFTSYAFYCRNWMNPLLLMKLFFQIEKGFINFYIYPLSVEILIFIQSISLDIYTSNCCSFSKFCSHWTVKVYNWYNWKRKGKMWETSKAKMSNLWFYFQQNAFDNEQLSSIFIFLGFGKFWNFNGV